MSDQARDVSTPDRIGEAVAARQWLVERCHHQRLSPTQRRVAQSFIDTMPDAAFLSTSEAALRAGVSQPTVTRFAAALGFGTYAEFRAALRHVILGDVRSPSAGADSNDPVSEAQANLADLAGTLGSAGMASAVKTLASARTLGILGIRASAALADYTGFFARRFVDDVRVLTDADSAVDTLVQMHHHGDGALLVFAMPRYPESTVRALRQARSLGIPTVLVIDSPFVDFANDADQVLVAPVGTGLVFDTHAGPIVLAMALLDGIAGADPRRTQARLESHEDQVDTWVHLSGSDPDQPAGPTQDRGR